MKVQIDQTLKDLLTPYKEGTLKEAMHYALSSKGKRIRPLLMLKVIASYGLPWEAFVDIACAIEMIHTYSLVHDDLPAMDNDDLRRGKKTVHKAYNEGLAILVGDGLLTDAFYIITQNKHLTPEQKVKCIEILSYHAGSQGMVFGQYKDLKYEGTTITFEQLNEVHIHKTAMLIQAPLMMGSVISNINDLKVWQDVGYHLGLMFQIQDDVLEHTQTEVHMGKSLSDEKNEKQTYIKHIGLNESLNKMNAHYEQIKKLMHTLNIQNEDFIKWIDQVYHRTY